MSGFYNDFMRDQDDFFNLDFVSGDAFSFTAKSSKADLSGTKSTIEQKATLKEQGEDDFKGYKLDTEVKLKQQNKEGKLDVKLTPSKIKVEKEHKPAQLNTVDSTGSVLGRVEHKVGGGNPDLTAGVKYGLPRLHESAGLWLEGNLTYKNFKQFNGDISGLLAINNQFFVGSQIIGDLEKKKADEITGVCGAQFDGNFVYLRANCLKHIVRLGFSTPYFGWTNKLAAEAKLDLDKEGPITDRTTGTVALDYPINFDSKLKFKFDISKKVFMHFSFIHKINENLQITFTDYANPTGFFRDSERAKYRLGVAFEAKF